MKLISWNVNGLRAVITKGFEKTYKEIDADILCLQETKMQQDQITDEINNIFKDRYVYWNSAIKKGYSGTCVISKEKTLNVTYGIGKDEHDGEGRVITLEFEKYFLVNCYTPNSKRELERLDYRMIWEDEIKAYLESLKSKKGVIYCGDLNVAHEEIDLKNPSTNHNSAGFTDKERNKMTNLLNAGFIDTFRYKYPDKTDMYSWWSYMFHAREKNVGWRIDYFIVSESLKDKIEDAKILTNIMGSDHCPVELDIKGL